jgi:hypothetical protein
VHLDIFSLRKMLHHKVSDLRIRVSAIATTSNPNCNSLEVAPVSNPSGSSSMSSIPSSYVSFQCFRLTEVGVGP